MRPNVLLIVADDLGFSDLGCYGGEIPTPHLDALAQHGIRLSQFYNTARCSPSRASLLTGLHPHQTGIGVLTRPDLPYGYRGSLDPETRTIADLLGDAGWTTAMFGKWHLAAEVETPNDSWPTRKGFAEFFGTLAGCSSYFDPQTLTRGEEPSRDAKDNPNFYYTDAIANRAVDWLGNREAASDPFFVYLAFTAPHWPLHALPEDLEAVRGRFDQGWDLLRERRLEVLKSERILDEDTVLSARDPSQPAWEDAPDKEWNISRMEAYAAQVVALDRAVGKVVSSLAHSGQLENTLVIFLSDNGASAEELPIGSLATFAEKDAVLRHGTRKGEAILVGNSPDILPGSEDTYASYGIPWANLSNAPLRRYKRWVHEGGISTPMIVSWPAGGLRVGTVRHLPAQLVDVVPTILDAVGLAQLSDAEGRSLVPDFRGQTLSETPLFWEHIGNCAVRIGRWKLVREYPGKWELYDIEADRTELRDLAFEHPDVVRSLAAAWQLWADRVGVLPWDPMVERYVTAGLPSSAAEE